MIKYRAEYIGKDLNLKQITVSCWLDYVVCIIDGFRYEISYSDVKLQANYTDVEKLSKTTENTHKKLIYCQILLNIENFKK